MMAQACPNCSRKHDVAVYVSGQRLRCDNCGISFEVKRTDVSALHGRTFAAAARSAASPVAGLGAGAGAIVAPGATVAYAGGKPPVPAFPSPNVAKAPGGHDRTFITPTTKHEQVEIPGYQLTEILGKGGMGEVWKAVQLSLNRVVAVKILPPKLASDPEFVTRFEKEATALAALNHPNVIQIIDRGLSGEHYYFVMEFVPGRSLRECMNHARLPPGEALKIIAQVCRAIDYAHEAGIIHRDLKPENILLDDRGHVKVADFGLAGIRGEERLQLTATRVAMGTVNYMAPEQRRDAKNVDGRADLYSLGVVLYELLTGELPIGRFKLPSERVDGLDVRVDAVVARTLENDPQARFQRASEVGHALESMISWVPGVPLGDSNLAVAPTGPRAALPAAAALPPIETIAPGRTAAGAAPPPAGKKLSRVARSGLHGLRLGLSVVGAVATLAFGARFASERLGRLSPPPNTHGDLFVVARAAKDGSAISTTFAEASSPDYAARIKAHAGAWKLENGTLRVTQAGNEVTPGAAKLIPRAYLGDRYFRAGDVQADAVVSITPLERGYAHLVEGNGFAEVALRRRDLQVSAFAIPGVGMRLGWRYFTDEGEEIQGNSSRDIDDLTEDPTAVPTNGQPLKVSLRLRQVKGGVEVAGFVNDTRFARKILPGLESHVGRVALGCRNLHCEFTRFDVTGEPSERPAREKTAPVE